MIIPKFKIPECPEHEVKSKIGIMFANEKILEEYYVKIYKIDPYFYEHYIKKKYKLTKVGVKVDVYFTEYLLAVEIDEKGHTDRDLIFEEKKQKALEKRLGCKFIRITTSKEGYNVDYEASRIQTFISKFKDRQLKKLNKKLKKQEDKIETLIDQTTQ